jgi:ABC-type lipoprotein export system ATPase subunit
MQKQNTGNAFKIPKYNRVAIVASHGCGKTTLLSAIPIQSKIQEAARELIKEF